MLISKCCNVRRTAEGLLLLSITFTVSVLAFQPVDAGVEVVKGLLLMHAHPFFFLHLWGLEAHHSRASHLDLQAAEVSSECTEDRKEPESPPDRQAARQHVKSA